jgi:hypothetical protein
MSHRNETSDIGVAPKAGVQSNIECPDVYDEEQLGRKVSLLLRELFGQSFRFTIDVNLKEGILRIVKQRER